MIAVNELRMGDHVLRTKWLQKDYENPDTWEYDQIIVDANDILACKVRPDHFNPIPLTPEILEKCGLHYYTKGSCSERYKYQEGYWGLISGTLYLKDGSDGFSVETITYSHEESTEIAVIKYLHQLQNLYYALTNQELTYDSTQYNKEEI